MTIDEITIGMRVKIINPTPMFAIVPDGTKGVIQAKGKHPMDGTRETFIVVFDKPITRYCSCCGALRPSLDRSYFLPKEMERDDD